MLQDIESFRKAGYAAIDSICDYYATLNQRPVRAEVQPGFLLESLPSAAPEKGEKWSTIANDFQSMILPGITHWQHGKFFAYFPSVSTFESMLGDLFATSVSNPGFNWICSPACTELEQVMMDWMASILGLAKPFYSSSKQGGGIILNSASEAALTAAMAAREKALRLLSTEVSTEAGGVPGSTVHMDVREKYSPKLVIYGSTQTHSLGAKAALLLGMHFRAVPVHAEDDYALTGAGLEAAIKEDAAKGLIPFFVIATVGTTNSGAVDRVAEIGQVLKRYPTAFLHVDAAWAGVAYALPEQRETLRLAEVNEYADSFCTNAHKWGLVAFDCSLFFVRDRLDLNDAFDVTPDYLRTREADAGAVIDYRNWQIALGRRFRSIKMWFVLRSYGIEGFQKHLRTGIDHCKQLQSVVEKNSLFELVTKPSLALLVFRLRGDGTASDEELDLLNQRLHDRLNQRSDVMLTQTVLRTPEKAKFCLRFAMGGLNSTMKDVEEVWEIVAKEGAAVWSEWKS